MNEGCYMHLQVFIIALLLTCRSEQNAPQGEILLPRQKLLVVSLAQDFRADQTGTSKLLSVLSAFLPDFKWCSHDLKT